jgi:hypothetical protein
MKLSRRWRIQVIALMAGEAVMACSTQPGSPSVRGAQADSFHGFRLGDSLPSFLAACTNMTSRVVAARGTVELVTLSTPGDCSTCMPHLAGLDSIAQTDEGPPVNYILAFTPGQTVSQLATLYSAYRSRDICMDSAGVAWDALDIQKTPVTVLLQSGRVMYITDKGYLSDSSRAKLLSDLEHIVPK